MRNYIDLMESLIKGEYVGEHGAPDKESGAPLYDLTLEGIYPDDVYGPNGARYYMPLMISKHSTNAWIIAVVPTKS